MIDLVTTNSSSTKLERLDGYLCAGDLGEPYLILMG